jgi:hypothetical protein
MDECLALNIQDIRMVGQDIKITASLKWAYMFNVYKNQQSRQTGSRNLMVPK